MESATYLSEIKTVLKRLGDMGKLQEIYTEVERRDRLPGIHTNENWRDNIRATIQRHCSETKSYDGGEDAFYSVYGLSEGCWGLKASNGYSDDEDENDLNPIIRRQIKAIKNANIDKTEKEMLIKARVGQGIFRKKLLEKYKKCIITGIDDPRLLMASHIKPWRSSNNTERLSEENGLLLSPLYDKLFDQGYITFDEEMRLVVSDKISQENISRIGICTDCCYLVHPSQTLQNNMEYHRNVVFKK